ncbi:MAG: hypothetical protein EBS50_10485 [Sphingomonadaceae bacterium]|nr:hypothetical protein [Sphingomonadaceae bacterium]NBU79476.1 hypothetical protein [Sphingomonadaceae bacterium]
MLPTSGGQDQLIRPLPQNELSHLRVRRLCGSLNLQMPQQPQAGAVRHNAGNTGIAIRRAQHKKAASKIGRIRQMRKSEARQAEHWQVKQ